MSVAFQPIPGARGVILATHQPIFLPWPGFFYKTAHSDCLVLLDDVQFPRGRSFINRNRLKNEDGELWLTVPVLKKGRGLQSIRRVEIHGELAWRRKHLESIRQNYVRAPYFANYFHAVETLYERGHSLLVDLNNDLITFLLDALSSRTEVLKQSDLGVVGRGTDLHIRICESVGADRLLVFPMVQKHIDLAKMSEHGIEVVHADFHPPVYPQLRGDFIYNLSTLDLLMNCGPKSAEIIAGAT
jgi:hypothetical protein